MFHSNWLSFSGISISIVYFIFRHTAFLLRNIKKFGFLLLKVLPPLPPTCAYFILRTGSMISMIIQFDNTVVYDNILNDLPTKFLPILYVLTAAAPTATSLSTLFTFFPSFLESSPTEVRIVLIGISIANGQSVEEKPVHLNYQLHLKCR